MPIPIIDGYVGYSRRKNASIARFVGARRICQPGDCSPLLLDNPESWTHLSDDAFGIEVGRSESERPSSIVMGVSRLKILLP